MNAPVRRLSNAQALLLQLFERDLSEEDITEVRNVLARHFFEKAQKEADKYMKENNVSLKDINKTVAELNKNRTEHKITMRRKANESSN